MTEALLGFAFAFMESGLGLGAVIPGEVAISGLATRLDGLVPLIVLGVFVAFGATTADHLGLFIGRSGGSRMRESRLIRRVGIDRWDRASGLIQRHGFWAVLVSRLLPVVRTVMPVVAGAAAIRYRSFIAASVIGAIAWSTVWVGAGAGIAASGILDDPRLVAGAVLLVVIAFAARFVLRRRRARREQRSDQSHPAHGRNAVPNEIL